MNLRKARVHQCGLTNLDGLKEAKLNDEKAQNKITSFTDSKSYAVNIFKGLKTQKSPNQSRLGSAALLTLKQEKAPLSRLNNSLIKVIEQNAHLKFSNEAMKNQRGESSDKSHIRFPKENSLIGKVISFR